MTNPPGWSCLPRLWFVSDSTAVHRRPKIVWSWKVLTRRNDWTRLHQRRGNRWCKRWLSSLINNCDWSKGPLLHTRMHTHTHTHTPCHHFQVVEHSQIICRIKQQANSLYISHASVWYESQIRWQEEERSTLNRCAWARVVRWGVWRLLGESKKSDFFSGCFSRGGLWADQWLSTGVLRLTGFGFTCLITALKMLSSSCLWTGSMFVCCQRTQTYTHTPVLWYYHW